MSSLSQEGARKTEAARKPRLGFVGVGWIGRHRLEAVAQSGQAEIVAIADAAPEQAFEAAGLAPQATLATCFDQLLEMELDGVVIATPNAFHVGQCVAALQRGLAVFCQKPLARTAAETRQVVESARQANRLLGVDLSYRGLAGTRKIRELIRAGELGAPFAAELVFHNGYGPDKAWFYDPKLSGGGCVLDLGIHLVDLALWSLDFPEVLEVRSRLFAQGKPVRQPGEQIEDYAMVELILGNGVAVQLSCSWKLPVGCNAIIRGAFYGAKGGAQFRNFNGSFTDFTAARFRGTEAEWLTFPPEDWGGQAILEWTAQLAQSPCFAPEIEHMVEVATVLDRIYERAA